MLRVIFSSREWFGQRLSTSGYKICMRRIYIFLYAHLRPRNYFLRSRSHKIGALTVPSGE